MLRSIGLLLGLLFLAPVFAQAPGGAGAAGGQPAAAGNATESPDAFEPTPGELITEEEDVTKLSEEQKTGRGRNLKAEELWKNEDFRDYNNSFTQLHQYSPAFTNNRYRLALSAYNAGNNVVMKLREGVELYEKRSREARHYAEKWPWQKVDRLAREEAQVRRMKREAKLEAVTYFTRSVNYMDEIRNPQLREIPAFKKLLSHVYRNWVMYQFDLGNIPQTIPILEQYIEIDENEKEYPAHKYLAQAYSFLENTVMRYKQGTEDQLLKLRYKKNVHLLRAAELKYGPDSVEYKHVVNQVNRDDIISVRP